MAVNLVDRPLETYASLDSFIHNDLASRWRDIAQDVATTRIFLASAVHAKNGATEVPIEGVEDTTVKEFLENFPKEGAGHLVTTMIYLIIEWDESRRVSYDTKKERTTPEDESLSSITPIIKQEYREPTPIAPIEWEEYQDEIFPENPLDPVTYVCFVRIISCSLLIEVGGNTQASSDFQNWILYGHWPQENPFKARGCFGKSRTTRRMGGTYETRGER